MSQQLVSITLIKRILRAVINTQRFHMIDINRDALTIKCDHILDI